jgi:hypothetical protein
VKPIKFEEDTKFEYLAPVISGASREVKKYKLEVLPEKGRIKKLNYGRKEDQYE